MTTTLADRFRTWARTGKASKESLHDFHKQGLVHHDEYDSPVFTDKGRNLLNTH